MYYHTKFGDPASINYAYHTLNIHIFFRFFNFFFILSTQHRPKLNLGQIVILEHRELINKTL